MAIRGEGNSEPAINGGRRTSSLSIFSRRIFPHYCLARIGLKRKYTAQILADIFQAIFAGTIRKYVF